MQYLLEEAHWGSRVAVNEERHIMTAIAPTIEEDEERVASVFATARANDHEEDDPATGSAEATTTAPAAHPMSVVLVNTAAGSPNRTEIHYDYPALGNDAVVDWHDFEARFGDTDFLIVHGPLCMNAEEGAIPEGDHFCLNPRSVDAICAHLPQLRWVNVRDDINTYDLSNLAFSAEQYAHRMGY